jgi:hypothetical protein
MQDISTQTLDAYTQHILGDQTMTPADRARHATVAIASHVMQEFRLPMDTDLPVDHGITEQMERDLETEANVNMNALVDQSMDAWEWLEEQFPEDEDYFLEDEVSDQKLADADILVLPKGMDIDEAALKEGLAETMKEPPERPLTLIPGGWVDPTPEEMRKFEEFWDGHRS